MIREADNFEGGNPHDLAHSGWIHEESSYFMRCCSGCMPGCRATKYVQHAAKVPDEVVGDEDWNWCRMQTGILPKGLTEEERTKSVIATHEKTQTCGACCSCCGCLPAYMETKDAEGNTLGKTTYVCDACICVPKFDVTDANGAKRYHLRPDTCFGGICVKCVCGGKGGKCFHVPMVVRDPETRQPLVVKGENKTAQISLLWAGLKNACCTKRNAYHLVFPDGATTNDKLTLMGSTILTDILYFEQEDDSGGGGGGG